MRLGFVRSTSFMRPTKRPGRVCATSNMRVLNRAADLRFTGLRRRDAEIGTKTQFSRLCEAPMVQIVPAYGFSPCANRFFGRAREPRDGLFIAPIHARQE